MDVAAIRSRALTRRCPDNEWVVHTPRHAAYDPDPPRRQDITVAGRAARTDGGQDVVAAARLALDAYGGDLATWRERLLKTLDRPESLFAVAEIAGQVAGYGKAAHCTAVSDSDSAPAGRYLTGLVVARSWRRCGIGELLTGWRLQRIHADGQAALFFTNARNTASINLHSRLGFVEVSRASSYLGEPFEGGVGVLMRCDP
jgi:ribosomal protein S18 acetylase RimI-like enzyme